MTILIVEDDTDLVDVLCFVLRRDGHDVIAAHSGDAGLQLWRSRDPQLVLLDADLPKVTGWEICKTIRHESDTPVIMMTGAATEADKIRGFDLGADDYITKPFSHRELVSRIRVAIRRGKNSSDQPRKGWQTLAAGDIRLDPQWRTVHRGGQAIRLTSIEFKILYELVLHEGQVLTYEILTDRVWGYDGVDDATLLKGHIRNMRRKLEPDPSEPTYIQTVPGVGYTFRRATPST